MIHATIQWRNAARGAACLMFFACTVLSGRAAETDGLKPAAFAHYIEHFNSMEDENFTNTIPNAGAWDWMQKEIPLFECPDKEVEEIYYFRWWSYRKHLEETATNGWVITEFLTPVKHGGHSTPSVAPPVFISPRDAGCTTGIFWMTTSTSGCTAMTAWRSRIFTSTAAGSRRRCMTVISRRATYVLRPTC